VPLEDVGFEVVAAANGAPALNVLNNGVDSFCVVVTGVNLGEGPDGWEVARRVRDLNDVLPVIYVSAASGREWKSKGVPNSVMIVKPFILTQLVTTIREVVWKDSSALLVRGRAHASTGAGFVRPPA
jgi:DNA-binding response OmpR family regulator